MARGTHDASMFWKLAVLIIWAGAVACCLLTLRQARLQSANEFAEARLRIRSINERVSAIRATLASEITPQRVESMAEEIGLGLQAWNDHFDDAVNNGVRVSTQGVGGGVGGGAD